MPGPDPMAIVMRAQDLAHKHDSDTLALLALDPVDIVGSMEGITVQSLPRTGGRCELDASYDGDTGIITLDSTASDSRRRFSCLHEFCHREIDHDGDISDWLYTLGKHQAHATEAL